MVERRNKLGVYDFAGFLCTAVVDVLPYIVVVRLVDIVLVSLTEGLFNGKLTFRGTKLNG